jgi:hypothetical protein
METDSIVSSKSDDNELLDAAEILFVAEAMLAWRSNRVIRSRLHWKIHVQMLLHENQFHLMYRMTIDHFTTFLIYCHPLYSRMKNLLRCAVVGQ